MTTSTNSTDLPAQPANPFALQEKVVLLLLTLRAPGNERTVKDKGEVLSTGAALGRMHVSKKLIEANEYKAISILDGQISKWVARVALPSPFKSGTHVVPIDMLDTVERGLTEYRSARLGLIGQLAEVYEAAKADAKLQLAELYRAEEYLTIDELHKAYSIKWQYVTLGAPDQIAAMNSEIFKREQARLQAQWDGAIDDMRAALRVGLSTLVDDMVARLSDGDKKFKPSKLLGRFDEFLSTFDARNVTNDAELATLASKARALLAGVDSDKLLKSKELREDIRAGFTMAQSELATLEAAPKRQRLITFEDE